MSMVMCMEMGMATMSKTELLFCFGTVPAVIRVGFPIKKEPKFLLFLNRKWDFNLNFE